MNRVANLRLLSPRHYTVGRCFASDVSNESEGVESKPKKPFYKRIFGSKREREEQALAEEEREYQLQNQAYEHVLDVQKRQELQKKRNKSRLRASDRRMLYGLPPLAGVEYEMNDHHRSQALKQNLLGLYGSKATCISPKVAWMTKKDLEERIEYERVDLDRMDLRETIQFAKQKTQEIEDRRKRREDEISANLAKLDDMLKRFAERGKAKEETANKEKIKRERILAELREEYGYDVDPRNPLFADKYSEKEKAYVKAQKEMKKAKLRELKAEK